MFNIRSVKNRGIATTSYYMSKLVDLKIKNVTIENVNYAIQTILKMNITSKVLVSLFILQ